MSPLALAGPSLQKAGTDLRPFLVSDGCALCSPGPVDTCEGDGGGLTCCLVSVGGGGIKVQLPCAFCSHQGGPAECQSAPPPTSLFPPLMVGEGSSFSFTLVGVETRLAAGGPPASATLEGESGITASTGRGAVWRISHLLNLPTPHPRSPS